MPLPAQTQPRSTGAFYHLNYSASGANPPPSAWLGQAVLENSQHHKKTTKRLVRSKTEWEKNMKNHK